ncbi:MAG: exonuclease domain-containing protein [Oscillospiraceae bacterium]
MLELIMILIAFVFLGLIVFQFNGNFESGTNNAEHYNSNKLCILCGKYHSYNKDFDLCETCLTKVYDEIIEKEIEINKLQYKANHAISSSQEIEYCNQILSILYDYKASYADKGINALQIDVNKLINEVNENIKLTEQNPYEDKTIVNFYHKAFTYPNTFVVVDLETTGLSPEDEEIIEIGTIKYNNGILEDTFHSLVNPHKPIPSSASAINHIYDKDVNNAPSFEDIADSFISFIEDYTLVAHNSSFDMKFIQTQLSSLGKEPLNNFVVDTLSLSRQYLPFLKNHKLDTIKDYLGLTSLSHTAIGDCEVTAKLYLSLLDKIHPINELTDEEQLYKHKIIEILVSEKRNATIVMFNSGKTYFDAICFSNLCRLKLRGKKQYLLINKSLDDFVLPPNCNLEVSESTKTEGDITRIFLTGANDLDFFKDYIISNFDRCINEYFLYELNSKRTR